MPDGLHTLLVHPDLVVETRVARERLRAPYAIGDFVPQSEALALFLAGLYTNDHALIRAGLKDVLVEPRRADLIPGFAAIKQAKIRTVHIKPVASLIIDYLSADREEQVMIAQANTPIDEMFDHDAYGASISGAGPSVFGWFASRAAAEAAQVDALGAFAHAGLEARAYVSPVASAGARIESCT